MTKPNIIEIMARASFERFGPKWSRVSAVRQAEFLGDMRAAISALDEAGFVVVPVEPTEAMVRTGAAVLDHPSVFMGGPSRQNLRNAEACYRAMIQAARDGK